MLISGQIFTVAASDIISSGRVSDLNHYVNGVSQSDERGGYDLYRGEYLSGGLYFERHLSLVHFTKIEMNSSKTRKTIEIRNTSKISETSWQYQFMIQLCVFVRLLAGQWSVDRRLHTRCDIRPIRPIRPISPHFRRLVSLYWLRLFFRLSGWRSKRQKHSRDGKTWFFTLVPET